MPRSCCLLACLQRTHRRSPDKMEGVSLLHIETRSANSLLGRGKLVRLSYFYTPSSFYVHLVEEDARYEALETEMQNFYDSNSIYTRERDSQAVQPRKLKIRNLQPKSYIAINDGNNWIRCLTLAESFKCRILDTGEHLTLERKHQEAGIYGLDLRFCSLPPRAILCGLGSILPAWNFKWSKRACLLFIEATRDRRLVARFLTRGLGFNTYYVSLTSLDPLNNKLHLHLTLCAYDEAVLDHAKLQHPIWPRDTPSA